MQRIFNEKNTLFFSQVFEQMQSTSNQQYDSFVYKYRSPKILRHSRHEVPYNNFKSYSLTDPI